MGFWDKVYNEVKTALNDKTKLDATSLEPSGILGRKRTARDRFEIEEQEEEINDKQRRIDAETMLQSLEDWNEIKEEYERIIERDCIDETWHLYWNPEVSSRAWNSDWQKLVGLMNSFLSHHSAEIQELTHRYPTILTRMSQYKPFLISINSNVFRMVATIQNEIIPLRNNQALRYGAPHSNITEQKSNVVTLLKNNITDTSLALSTFWTFIRS